MHLEKAYWIIDNADLFIGEGTPIEEWCLLYKRLTRMSIGELTGGVCEERHHGEV